MINVIWVAMLSIGILVAALTGKIDLITTTMIASAGQAVTISLEIIGVLSLWLGLLKIAEKSGIVDLIAKIFNPVISLLFPGIPKNHPAMAAIIMNLSANVLGLGSAATPFGLKAMEQLQTLNPQPDTASDGMITFLALNTSCLTLLPTMVLSLRIQAHSVNPMEIIVTTALATFCGSIIAIMVDWFCRRRSHKVKL